jgi:hypothetical protein
LQGSPLVGPLNGLPPASLDSEMPQVIPVVSAGRTEWEYFTITSSRGDVRVPVEVHVASRQADEKRKRNAGASARFRQRRKEKEREANSTIDRLKDELRMMSDARDYYKSERDRYLEVLKDTPGWERYLPRSPSPRPQRRAQSSHTVSTSGITSGAVSPTSPLPPNAELHTLPGNETERNTRRRIETDSYHSSGLQPQDSVSQQSYQSPFAPFSPVHGPHRSHSHPSHNAGSPGAPSHPNSIGMADTNHPGNSGYERPWPPHSMNTGRG